MTLVENRAGSALGHVGELRLRRFRAGELSGDAEGEVARHTAECSECRAKLRLLQEEQRQFEREIPFERFAGGVERARRVPRARPRRLWTIGGGLGLLAAAATVLLVTRPWTRASDDLPSVVGGNGVKGSSLAAEVRIASAQGGPQRRASVDAITELRAGDRVRVGYKSPRPHYLVALSVDDAGEITPLYPQQGAALSVGPARSTTYLPDSLELTGAGRERVYLFLAEQPLDLTMASQALRNAYAQGRGDLGALPQPSFASRADVQQFSWLFRKP